MHLVVDLMGADRAATDLLQASLDFVASRPVAALTLAAAPELADKAACLPCWPAVRSKIRWLSSSQVVDMQDSAATALRHKSDSSMYLSLACLAGGEADACVSAGNTGALVAMCRHLLGTLPGIDRPAIVKPIPALGGKSYVLDLGANINCSQDHLVQFALMGAAAFATLEGRDRPRVALLNLGVETTRGGRLLQSVADRLQTNPCLNYVGFVEGDAIFQGGADVIVCDGLVGNVALKTSEGLARYVAHQLRLLDRPGPLAALHQHLDPDGYNGALLTGLSRVVIKSHGNASQRGFYQALVEAERASQQQLPERMAKQVSAVLKES